MGGTAQPLRVRAGWKRGLWPSSMGKGMVAWPLVLTRVPELGARGWACWGGAQGRGLTMRNNLSSSSWLILCSAM